MHRLTEEQGQTFVEWLALMAVIVALVGVLAAAVPGIADAITDKASELIRGVG
jgi:hypothetical protein